MKSKFGNFDFGSVAVLSREEQSKVKGGAYGTVINTGCTATLQTDPVTGETKTIPCSNGYLTSSPNSSGIWPSGGAYR
jgi:hypothetical protein